MESLFDGDLVAVNLTTWLVPGQGWCLRVQRTYDVFGVQRRVDEKYDRLGRGELVDVVDAVRDQLNIGTEY